MNIDKTLSQLEDELEKYENANEPDERLELKQNIKAQLKMIRQFSVENNKELSERQKETVADIEEILSY